MAVDDKNDLGKKYGQLLTHTYETLVYFDMTAISF